MSQILPSEDWAPYRWLWTRIGGQPWTHIMRANPRVVIPLFAALLAVVVFWWARRWWAALLAFLIGMLFGHAFW